FRSHPPSAADSGSEEPFLGGARLPCRPSTRHRCQTFAGHRRRAAGRYPGTSPAALAFRVPTPHNKYVAGSAPAARALRPTWPSSVCGSNTGCRVFSDRRLVALWWWATSATSERYVVIGRAYQVTLAAAPHEGPPRSARVD